ncbi:MAG: pyridoxine 5'-phosphate synthase [Acetobacteraceae bacterium]
MARLSVNLNKIALLRNSRRTGIPDLRQFARIAIDAGARGITVHPRSDERHIRRSDVPALASVLAPLRPRIELNIEGYPDQRLLEIVRDARAEQCTLVPDAPDAFTSEKGWELDAGQMRLARPAIVALKALGARVILFIDPDPGVLDRVIEAGADGVEIYTGGYAGAFRAGDPAALLDACAETARQAEARHLVVNAGHDLNLRNLPPLMARIPFLGEASIGHELTADALEMGFAAAVAAYAKALAAG